MTCCASILILKGTCWKRCTICFQFRRCLCYIIKVWNSRWKSRREFLTRNNCISNVVRKKTFYMWLKIITTLWNENGWTLGFQCSKFLFRVIPICFPKTLNTCTFLDLGAHQKVKSGQHFWMKKLIIIRNNQINLVVRIVGLNSRNFELNNLLTSRTL